LSNSVDDPYIWLENLNDQRVLDWISFKNKKTREYLGEIPDKLFQRVLKYYNIPNILLARLSRRGIYLLVQEELDRRIYRINQDGSREIIVSSKDLGENIVLTSIEVNEEGDRLVYRYSSGSDVGVTKIIDPFSGEVINTYIGDVGDFIWIDRDRYYYVKFYRSEKTPDNVDPPAERVFLHQDGFDEMVWGAGLSTNYMISLSKNMDASKILVTVFRGWSFSNIYGGDLRDPSTWVKIVGDDQHLYYPIEYVNGRYYILAYDGRGLGRIVELKEPGVLNEIIPEHQRYPLRNAVMTSNRIIANYFVDASSILKIYDHSGSFVGEFKPTPPGSIDISLSKCIDDKCIFKYQSFYIPYRLYLYVNDDFMIIDKLEYGEELFGLDEFWVKSYDKTPIHVFHIFNKTCSNRKTVLYGYGGFGVSVTPFYLSYLLVFIEDCGSVCVANIRGGGEYGEEWHKAGKKMFKENVFQDFISVARYLKNNGYGVVAMGSSNGGLLTAVTMVRAPDLLDGVLIGYPLTDMLRFHKLYVGKLWVDEYGDPDNPSERAYLLKYSPYHNIVKGVKYSTAMIYTGLHDDRVHPAHALKFSAKLDEYGVENLLRVEMLSGHSGANPVIKVRELVDILSFIYRVFRLDP